MEKLTIEDLTIIKQSLEAQPLGVVVSVYNKVINELVERSKKDGESKDKK